MKIVQSQLNDPEYNRHLREECDLDCRFCQEEDLELAKQPKIKKEVKKKPKE